MMSTLFTITFLIVFAVVLVLAVQQVRRRTQEFNASIAAEVWADDVIEGSEPKPGKKRARSSQPQITYRWGRIAIFGVAVLSLLGFIITAILAVTTAIVWSVPIIFLLASFAGFATLRFLAIRDMKKRAEKRRSEHREEVSQIVLKPNNTERKVLKVDAAESGATQVKPIKHGQQKPINYASKSLRYARTHHQSSSATPMEFKKLPSGSINLEEHVSLEKEATWEVRDTPRPTYLDAEVKYRDVPVAAAPQKAQEESESATISEAAVKAQSMNLDDILTRRRA